MIESKTDLQRFILNNHVSIIAKTRLFNVVISTAKAEGINDNKWFTFLYKIPDAEYNNNYELGDLKSDACLFQMFDKTPIDEFDIYSAVDNEEEAFNNHRECICYILSNLDVFSFMKLFEGLEDFEYNLMFEECNLFNVVKRGYKGGLLN